MATADSLMGLISQLQLMENSITNFIFETAMKLSALTEAKIFVLIDSQQGRRYCGNKHLVDTYMSGNLDPLGNEVEIQLDPLANPLKLKVQQTNGFSKPHTKRHWTSSIEPVSTFDNDSPTARKKQRHDKQIDAETQNKDQHTTVSFSAHETKTENDFVKKEIEELIIESDDDDDADLDTRHESEYENSVTNFQTIPIQNPAFPLDIAQNFNTNKVSKDNFTNVNEKKIEALQTITDPWLVYQKGTLENKLFASVFYDFGKELAMTCPFEEVTPKSSAAQTYFYSNLEQFWSSFPLLYVDRDSRPHSLLTDDEDLLKQFTPQAYMRHNARNGFKRGCIQRSKKF